MLLAATIFGDYLGPIIAAFVVVVGLFVGLRDTLRFSISRAWAISTVCFQQSIRRRVLWITPLVILGVIAVSQYQKVADYQDEIRLTTTYCLFATGMLVALVTVILACTNLPAEIESRVIYTIATKPVTRLEIVLGKVIGFVCVSGSILLIMGLFTYGYLSLGDWRTRAIIRQVPNWKSQPTLAYYATEGTLHSREFGLPHRMGILAHVPKDEQDWWVPGDGSEGQLISRFIIDKSAIPAPDPKQNYPGGLAVKLTVTARAVRAPSTRPTTAPVARPRITFDLQNPASESVVPFNIIQEARKDTRTALELPTDTGGAIMLRIPADMVERWLPGPRDNAVQFAVHGVGADYEYKMGDQDIMIGVPLASGAIFKPVLPVTFSGRNGFYGEQLRGSPLNSPNARAGVYEFRHQKLADRPTHPFELRLSIEPNTDEGTVFEGATQLQITFRNIHTGASKAVTMDVENNRPIYFDVPADTLAGGDFDAIIQMTHAGWLNLRTGPQASLKLVGADQIFAWNLIKSLLILWLMSLLLTIIAVFCSTFLSWPIAVVLTVVILCGRWGAEQLGDLTQPGLGRRTAVELFRVDRDAVTAHAISESVDVLISFLNTVSSALPDLSKFAAMDAIDQGVAIPSSAILDPLKVLLLYGLPLLVLSYVFLKYKEVAP